MENLNQKSAISHFNGPCLVLAGPGSGKTYTLTNRIYNLIKTHHVNDENILVVTFTRKAANEMKERFQKMCKNSKLANYENVNFGTFHSIFFEILRTSYSYTNNSLLKYDEKLLYYKEIVEMLVHKGIMDASSLPRDIESLKTSLMEFLNYKTHIQNFNEKIDTKSTMYQIYRYYFEKCKKEKKLDYDDMITLVRIYFQNDKNTLLKYQNLFQYILIDEFQDINLPQYEIIKMISKTKNLFCVGDDDQSIYNFRGVSPKIMQQFLNDYNNAKIYNLNINYRSTKDIITYATNVIKHNKLRLKKELLPSKTSKGLIEVKSFENVNYENEYVLNNIKKLYKIGLPYKEMAILYRTNNVPLSLVDYLKSNNIPFNIKDKIFNIYETFYIKDIIAYLKLATNKFTSSELYRIANKPNRYITRQSIPHGDASIDNLLQYYRFTPYMIKTLKKFKKQIEFMSSLPTSAAIEYILDQITYREYLENYCNEKNINLNEITDNIREIQDEAILYPKISDFLTFCDKNSIYLSSLANTTQIDENTNENAINLMTFHSSKGLEFMDVQIIDANDGIIPHKKSLKNGDIEAERRLFYVALTRSKQNLHIYFTNLRYARKQEKSRFIQEGM